MQIHDTKNLMVIKTFNTETPLNSAALAPNRPFVSVYATCLSSGCNFRFVGSTWRGPRGYECHHNIRPPRQVRDSVLAQGVRRGSWTRQGTFWSCQYVRDLTSYPCNRPDRLLPQLALPFTQLVPAMLPEEKMVSYVCIISMTRISKRSRMEIWKS